MPELVLTGLSHQMTVMAIPTAAQDTARWRALNEQGLEVARALADGAGEARVSWNCMLLEMYSGHRAPGIPHGEPCAQLCRQLGLSEQLAYAVQDLALAYMGVWRLADAAQALADAQTLWRDAGNQAMLVENLANSAYHRVLVGAL